MSRPLIYGNDVHKPLGVVSSASASNEAKYDAVLGITAMSRRHAEGNSARWMALGNITDHQKCLKTCISLLMLDREKPGGCYYLHITILSRTHELKSNTNLPGAGWAEKFRIALQLFPSLVVNTTTIHPSRTIGEYLCVRTALHTHKHDALQPASGCHGD